MKGQRVERPQVPAAGVTRPRRAIDATAGTKVWASPESRPIAGEAGGPKRPASTPAKRKPIIEAPHQSLTKHTAAQDEARAFPNGL